MMPELSPLPLFDTPLSIFVLSFDISRYAAFFLRCHYADISSSTFIFAAAFSRYADPDD